ncbi:MAG: SIMPL domain-containing protein [Candidatus Aenigmarchaeota archaeon]|nr:SIMPL domain-containing protein [Candidatus Aenigmarchaeota archaeon]
MNQTKTLFGFAAVFVVVTLALLTAVNDQRQELYANPSQETKLNALFGESFMPGAWAAEDVTDNTMFVSATASASANPDKVTIYFSVETQDDSALRSQQENAGITTAVRSALTGMGLEADSIETTGYTLSQVREYDYETRKYTNDGFMTIHSMKVELSDTSRAGEVIDAAVSAGVNSVNSVSFGLSDEKMEELRLMALETAAKTSLEKADAMAKGLGVTVSRVMSATEGYSYSPSVNEYRTMDYAMAEGAGVSPSTDVTPGEVSVTASVNVVFEIA